MTHEEFKALANKHCNQAVRLGLVTHEELMALNNQPAEVWDAFWVELHKRFTAYRAKRRDAPLDLQAGQG